MPPVADELKRLQRELDDLRLETRANTGALAGAVRKSRLNLAVVEHNESLRKLRQPTSLLDWTPRPGKPTEPDVQNSLLDRLRRGSPVADSLGNVDVYVGQSNVVLNPLFDGVDGTHAITAVSSAFAPDWNAAYVLNSGAAPSAVRVVATNTRGDITNNPLNSAVVRIQVDVAAAAARDLDVYLWPTDWTAPFHSLSHMVGSFRVPGTAFVNPAHWTTLDVFVELYNVTTGAVVASSAGLNMHTLDGRTDVLLLYTSIQRSAAQFEAATWRLRYRAHLVSNGAAATSAYLSLGEPLLHFSYSPDPAPFTPLIAAWIPSIVSSQFGSESYERLRISDEGLLFGLGTTPLDVRIKRGGATGALIFDTNGVAGTADVQVQSPTGYNAYLSAVAAPGATGIIRSFAQGDTIARAHLEGGAVTALRFGPGNAALDTQIYRLGAGRLVVDSAGAPVLTQFIVATSAGYDAYIDAQATGAGQTAYIRGYLAGDAYSRFQLQAGAAGTGLFMGSGASVALQVVGLRKTGWGAPTGTATRTTFNTATVTLAQLAERVKALIDDLTTHGLIGA